MLPESLPFYWYSWLLLTVATDQRNRTILKSDSSCLNDRYSYRRVPIQIIIQKHLSPKVIPDKVIKKQTINAYLKTKSKTTVAGKLFEHLSPSYFVHTYFWLQKQL